MVENIRPVILQAIPPANSRNEAILNMFEVDSYVIKNGSPSRITKVEENGDVRANTLNTGNDSVLTDRLITKAAQTTGYEAHTPSPHEINKLK